MRKWRREAMASHAKRSSSSVLERVLREWYTVRQLFAISCAHVLDW